MARTLSTLESVSASRSVRSGRFYCIIKGLNTFTSFDAPSRDMWGWSMHIEV